MCLQKTQFSPYKIREKTTSKKCPKKTKKGEFTFNGIKLESFIDL